MRIAARGIVVGLTVLLGATSTEGDAEACGVAVDFFSRAGGGGFLERPARRSERIGADAVTFVAYEGRLVPASGATTETSTEVPASAWTAARALAPFGDLLFPQRDDERDAPSP